MRRLQRWVWVALQVLLSLSCFAQSGLMPIVKPEDVLGFWGDRFPVPDNVSGYILLDTGEWFYYDTKDKMNIAARYYGSYGHWSILENSLRLVKNGDFYWESPYVFSQSLGYIPGAHNILVYTRQDNEESVQRIPSYGKPSVIVLEDGSKLALPTYLVFKPIINGEYSSKNLRYWKIADEESVLISCQDVLSLMRSALRTR